MGVGHQSWLLSSAFLGGPFVGYSSFFVLQVMAGSFFVLIKMLQSPSCTYQGQLKLPLVLVKDAPDSQATSSYTGRDLVCQYFIRCLLSVIFPIITRWPLWLLWQSIYLFSDVKLVTHNEEKTRKLNVYFFVYKRISFPYHLITSLMLNFPITSLIYNTWTFSGLILKKIKYKNLPL